MKQTKISSLKQKIICIPIIMMTLISFIIPNYAHAGLGENIFENLQEIFMYIPDAFIIALERYFVPESANKKADDIIKVVSSREEYEELIEEKKGTGWFLVAEFADLLNSIPIIGDLGFFLEQTVSHEFSGYVISQITYSPKMIFSNKVPALNANFFKRNYSDEEKAYSVAYQLKNVIATWYVSLRNIALVLMLLVLVWIGIKITLSSISSEKAKYKQLLIDWIVAICLLIFLHYIMVFAVNIVEQFTKMISVTTGTEDFINLARTNAASAIDEETGVTMKEKFFWTVVYVVLVIYTIIFTWQYLKRVIKLAFLTLLAPIIAASYPIDKMTDGQAQGFNSWLKDYIYELLIQPLHLILYTILISSVQALAMNNPIYPLVALGSLIYVEKMLRDYLGFERKGHVKPPNPAGLLAAATLGRTAMNALLPSNVKNKSGKGGDSRDGANEKPVDTSRGDNPYALLAGGNGQTEEEEQEDVAEDRFSNRPDGNGLNPGQNEQENEDGGNEPDTNKLPNGYGNGPVSDNQEDWDALRGTLNEEGKGYGKGPISDNPEDYKNLKGTSDEDGKGYGNGKFSDNQEDYDTLKGTLNETGKGYGKGKFSDNPADYDALKAAQKGIPKPTKATNKQTKNKRNIKKPSNFKRGAGAVARKYGGRFVRGLTGGKTGVRGIAHALAGVARVGAGAIGAFTLGTAGIAMGVAMGDISKGVQLGAAGLATGYGAGSRIAGAATGLIGKGADAVTGVANTYNSAANPEKYDKKLQQREQERIVNDIRDNDNAMRMFRMKNPNMTDKEITQGINDCVKQGIDSPEDMQKIFELEEKAGVDRNTAIGAMKVSKKVDAATLRDEKKSEGFRKSIENNLQGRTENAEQKSYEAIDLIRMIHGEEQMSRTRTQAPRPEPRTQPANETSTSQSNNQPQQPTPTPRSGRQSGSGRGSQTNPTRPRNEESRNTGGGSSNKPPRTRETNSQQKPKSTTHNEKQKNTGRRGSNKPTRTKGSNGSQGGQRQKPNKPQNGGQSNTGRGGSNKPPRTKM